ncbi:phage minor head protein, partial [Falsiroseomonas sp.]|uniref:phage head morphogenesis protein n=1 Tax=Falsiroseomonas sp. TaxID=2870721 RepID=UPI002721F9B2
MTTTIQALNLPNREALAFFLGKTNVSTQHWTDVWQEGHSRGFMVAGAAGDDLLNDFRGAIRQAIEDGTTLADFRKQFDQIVSTHGWAHNGGAAWRSRVIYETNLSTAYSAGRYAQMTEPDTLAVYPFWQYVHSGALHPRLNHQAWNGLVLRADDPFWKTHNPPNGWGCGCYTRPVSGRGLQRMGKAGPDQAPEVTFRDWRNPNTGQVMQVPVGIDPGFGYNPGEAWRGTMAFPADAVSKVPPAPPPPVMPPPRPAQAPALDAGPVVVERAQPFGSIPLPPAPAPAPTGAPPA